jgi:hypothetical protein
LLLRQGFSLPLFIFVRLKQLFRRNKHTSVNAAIFGFIIKYESKLFIKRAYLWRFRVSLPQFRLFTGLSTNSARRAIEHKNGGVPSPPLDSGF